MDVGFDSCIWVVGELLIVVRVDVLDVWFWLCVVGWWLVYCCWGFLGRVGNVLVVYVVGVWFVCGWLVCCGGCVWSVCWICFLVFLMVCLVVFCFVYGVRLCICGW